MTTYPNLAAKESYPSTTITATTIRGRNELIPYLVALLCGSAIGAIALFSPWLALASVFGIGLLFLFLIRPVALCYMLIAAIVLSSGMERGAIVPQLKPNELGLLLAAGITLLIVLAKRSARSVGSSYSWFSLVTLGIGTVILPVGSYLVRDIELSPKDLLTLIAPLQYFLLFWVFATLPQNEHHRYQLLFWMIMGGGGVAVIGLLQAANVGFVLNILSNYYPSSHGNVSSEVGRVTSVLGAWNATGIFLMASTLVGWAFLPEVRTSGARFLVICMLIVMLLGLIATGSFAGIGVLAVGLMIMSILQGKGGRILSIILLGMVVGFAIFIVLRPILGPLIEQRLDYQFGGRQGQSGWVPQTLSFRFRVWGELFWPAIREHPIWGFRPTIPTGFGWHAMESQYIFLLFTSGLVGLTGWVLWLSGTFIWLLRRKPTSVGLSKCICISTLVLLTVMTIAGLTNEVFTFLGSIDYLWILLALTANGSTD